jgi:hypothetical protein
VVVVTRGAFGRGLRSGTFATVIAWPIAGTRCTSPAAAPTPPASPSRAAILIEGRLG